MLRESGSKIISFTFPIFQHCLTNEILIKALGGDRIKEILRGLDMVRVLVLYPRIEGKKFDFNYYKNHHMKLVKEKLNPVKVEIDFGIVNQENPSPYIVVSHMIFESQESN